MGGWNTMPGFCSWGLSPLPSSGVKASRANGFAANSITVTKNAATAHTTPATYGSSGAWRRDVNVTASEPNSDSTLAQKSRLPLARVQRRPGVEDRQVAAGVGGDVLDVEVVVEQRPLEREDRRDEGGAHSEDGAARALLEVRAAEQPAREARYRPPDPDEEGDPQRQVAEDGHPPLGTAS